MTRLQLTDEIYVKLVSKHRTTVALFLKELFSAGYEGKAISIKEAAEISHFSAQVIRRIAREGIYVHTLTPKREEVMGQTMNKNQKRGRPEKMVQVPTLKELEDYLECKQRRERHFEIDTTQKLKAQVQELKAQVAAVGLIRKTSHDGYKFFGTKGVMVKSAELPNNYLIKSSMMTKNTWKKHFKRAARSFPVFEKKELTTAILDQMPEFYSKGYSGFWLEVDGQPFASTKRSAAYALEYAGGDTSKVVTVRQKPSLRVLTIGLGEREKHAIACYAVDKKLITLDDYKRMYPFGLFDKVEHPEHQQLIAGMRGADEIMHDREKHEEQAILKEISFRKL